MGFVINPATLVLISVDMPEGALAMGLVVAPVSLIARTILPDLFALTMPILIFPLPSVLGPVLEDVLGPGLNISIIVGLASQEFLSYCAPRCIRFLLSPYLVSLH